MDYLNDPYRFPPQHHPHMMHYQPMTINPYPGQPFPGQPQPMDPYFQAYAAAEYADFAHHGPVSEEYDEGGEVLTRPRLTREQVEVLEAQFQAQQKPSSMTKRQLAQQTKLTLPRVANWFQNRRAKAKQQRKQEEFETTQQLAAREAGSTVEASSSHQAAPLQLDTSDSSTQYSSSSNTVTDSPSMQSSASSVPAQNPHQDAAWNSLQRALTQAKQSQDEGSEQHEQAFGTMPPPELPRPMAHRPLPINTESDFTRLPVSAFSDWSSTIASSNPWTSAQPSDHGQFNFGFTELDHTDATAQTNMQDSLPIQGYVMPVDDWSGSTNANNLAVHTSPVENPVAPVLQYATARRGSTSDELTANFGTFALAGTPPIARPSPVGSYNMQPRPTEGESDLAARRKRPPPPPLGSAALRSRSYGALSSMSPTFRPGSSLANPHSVRHVKSTGHSLNVRYAGIRKPSSAQRSPLNVASFAEAEVFHRLMAQQAVHAKMQDDTAATASLSVSPEGMMNCQLPNKDMQAYQSLDAEQALQYHLHAAQTLHPSLTSPPSTPFRSEYFMPSSLSSSMPPVSAPPQYATFPDDTPPYSAGPMTNSSWSDAPLTSPDLAAFPSMAYMSSMQFPYCHEASQEPIPSFLGPSTPKLELVRCVTDEHVHEYGHGHKQTEFFIHEFPGQKEEHAHVAQQMSQSRPKNYVFNNAGPNDY